METDRCLTQLKKLFLKHSVKTGPVRRSDFM
jgi:hypothetical protein